PRRNLFDKRLRLLVMRQRGGEIGIVREQALFESVEFRLVVDLPPAVAGQLVRRLRGDPRANGLVLRGNRRRRHLVLRRERTRGHRERAGKRHGKCQAGAESGPEPEATQPRPMLNHLSPPSWSRRRWS